MVWGSGHQGGRRRDGAVGGLWPGWLGWFGGGVAWGSGHQGGRRRVAGVEWPA